MKQTLRKGVLLGLGITALAHERVTKEVKDWCKENDITPSQAQLVAKEFLTNLDSHQQEIVKTIEKEATKAQKTLKKTLREIKKHHQTAQKPTTKKRTAKKPAKKHTPKKTQQKTT